MDFDDKSGIETNLIEEGTIKKTLIAISSLIGKALVIDYILNIIIILLGEFILDVFKGAGFSLNYESLNSINEYSVTVISEILVFMWLIKKAKIRSINILQKKVKLGNSILKYISFLFTAQLLGTICYMLIQLISMPFGISWGGSELEFPATSVLDSVIYCIFVCIAAPIGEELLFRGAILKSLLPYGSRFAIIISAVLFGLVHGNFEQIPFALFVGLIFGYIAVKTDSLFYAITLHIFNNSWAVAYELFYNAASNVVMNIVLIIIMLIGACGLIIIFQDRKEMIMTINESDADCVACSYHLIHKYFFKSFWMWCALIIMVFFCITSIMH